ncbi:TIGR04076 family protein [candidate division KSB1 bacterium]
MSKIKVTVEKINGYCNLPVHVGDYFYVDDSKLIIPDGKHVCIWALQSMMPVFPILNEKHNLKKDHWVRKVETFSCPDPKGLVQYRVEIIG